MGASGVSSGSSSRRIHSFKKRRVSVEEVSADNRAQNEADHHDFKTKNKTEKFKIHVICTKTYYIHTIRKIIT